VRKDAGGLHAPHETEPGEQRQHPPSRIELARSETELGGAGKSVVVVVPGFTHGDQPAVGHVVALHAGSLDMPGAKAGVVCKIADQPVSGYRHRHPRSNAPDHPGHATERQEQQRPWQLLQHPGTLQEPVEAVLGNAALEN
jgi:hypothetical protein